MTVARAMSSFIMPNMRQELVRQLLDNAHEIHENSGYIHGTRFALDLLGVRIRWTQWHNETPPAYHDTHKVRVFLNSSLIEDVSPLDPENQQAIARLIEVTKRKSQDLDVFYGLDSRIKVYTGVAHVKGRAVRINALSVSNETFQSQQQSRHRPGHSGLCASMNWRLDMAQDFFSIMTTVGLSKLAIAIATESELQFTEFAIGDGNGLSPDPSPNDTELVHEVWRTGIEGVIIDPDNPSAVLVSAIIPREAGGWYMREYGLFDVDGDMVAVVKPVPQFKPTAAQGQLEDIRYEFQIIVGETANINLLVSPSVLFATREWTINGFVQEPRKINTEDGIGGGGDLSEDRTFKLAVGALTAIVGNDVDDEEDSFVLHDGSADDHKKITAPELLIALGVQEKIDIAANNLPWATPEEFADEATEDRIAHPKQIHDLLNGILKNNLVFPEIETADAKLLITDNADGTLTIDAAQTWLWRGVFRFSSDDINLAGRTVTTVANKTYHVRWHAPGTGTAAPVETYPNGRIELVDITAAAPPEGDETYDTTYDKMLVARIVTDGANAATITALANKAALSLKAAYDTTSVAYGDNAYGKSFTTSLEWGRRPALHSFDFHAYCNNPVNAWSQGGSQKILTNTGDRYAWTLEFISDWNASPFNPWDVAVKAWKEFSA